jgi:hypothetical protein
MGRNLPGMLFLLRDRKSRHHRHLLVLVLVVRNLPGMLFLLRDRKSRHHRHLLVLVDGLAGKIS